MIKVLHVFASLEVGGAESRIMDVFRAIDKTQFSYDFLTMQETVQYFENEIRLLGGNIIKLKSPRESGPLRNLLAMCRIMKTGGYDAVHAHTSFHCGLVMMAAAMANVPVRISHARTTGSKHCTIKNRLALRIGRILIDLFSTARLAISKDAGRYLFGGRYFEVLPNAIDCTKYFKVTDTDINTLRDDFQLSCDVFVIGMVGRFESMKNHRFALEWFASYLKAYSNAVLVFVGDGTLRLEMEELAHSLSVSKSVLFTGIRSDVNVWMNIFDLLIVPSLFEGLGGVIMEGQAAGKPVVKSSSFTNEADLGLGLVREMPFNASYDEWSAAVNEMRQLKRPSQEQIHAAFNAKGYSLSVEVKRLSGIYEGMKA